MPKMSRIEFELLCEKNNVCKHDAFEHPYIQDALIQGECDIVEYIERLLKTEFNSNN